MFKLIINTLYPAKCILCQQIIEDVNKLCSICWAKIKFIDPHHACHKCGCYLNSEMQSLLFCTNCCVKPPIYNQSRSLFVYDNNSNKLITDFKYFDKTNNAIILADLLSNRLKDFIEYNDIIIPVPMHKLDFIKRRYNQTILLANKIAAIHKKPVIYDAILKIKRTKKQVGQTKKQRMENLKKAFSINNKKNNIIFAKKLLLVDDVITTGATISECSKILLKAGAGEVNILSLAIRHIK